MIGQIVKIINEDCFVSKDNKIYVCKPRGKLRNDNVFLKVGDYVSFDDKNNYIL